MGERKKKIQINSAVILLVIIALLSYFIFSFVQYYREMDQKIAAQTKHDLQTTNDTAKAALNSLLKDGKNWLESLAVICDIPDGTGKENWWNVVKKFDTKGMKIGVADSRGTIYYSSHKKMDISGRQYYKVLKKQKSSISKVLFDEEEAYDKAGQI